MNPARKGDGTELSFKGFSEVRKGDGKVLWKKNTIPESTIHRWKLDDINTGTVTDSIGNADGSVSGVSSVSGDYIGGKAGESNSSSDKIETTTLGDHGTTFGSGSAMLLTIEGTATGWVAGADDGSDDQYIQLGVGTLSSSGFDVSINGDSSATEVSTTTSINDGDKHRIGVNFIDISNEDIEIYVDGAKDSLDTSGSSAVNITSDWGDNFEIFNRTVFSGDSFQDRIDDFIITEESLSSDQFNDDYNRQPWS